MNRRKDFLPYDKLPPPPPPPQCSVNYAPAGVKHDDGKDRWDLLPWDAVREIVRVLTVGAAKYDDDNWKRVPGARARYEAAFFRHATAYFCGEKNDPDTGLSHLGHASCSILFLAWFDLHPGEEVKDGK